MAYQEWFDDWRRGEVCLRGYFQPPAELTPDRIAGMERSAADLLERVRQLAADLTEYRQALSERYAALSVMPYNLRLELERCPNWDSGRVKYFVRIIRTYEDGTQIKELEETYPGQQRREALARYEALRRERPGIEAVKDIARKRWEK